MLSKRMTPQSNSYSVSGDSAGAQATTRADDTTVKRRGDLRSFVFIVPPSLKFEFPQSRILRIPSVPYPKMPLTSENPQLRLEHHTGLSSATNFFFRKRRFSSGDVCEVAPVPPPAPVFGGYWRRSRFKLEMGVFGGLMEDCLLHLSPKRKPHKLISACEALTYPSAPPGTRTPNLLIKSQLLYQLS